MMLPLISLTVLTVLVSPAFSQYQRQQQSQRACDLRSCNCIANYQPFCGTDEITYSNKCNLECAQRQCNSNIRVKFEGVCAEKYVHDEGESSNSAESRKNFAVIRPPINYQPESPSNSYGRLPATIPTPTTRRTTTNYYEYGTTQRPTTNYFQYGTTRRPTTNYFLYETTRRPTTNYFQYENTRSTPNYFQYSTTQRPIRTTNYNQYQTTQNPGANYFEYSTTRKPTANYFEYSTSRRPTTNFFEYSTTARPYGGVQENRNILYGTNDQGNDRKDSEYNQNQIGRQYGDFYDYSDYK